MDKKYHPFTCNLMRISGNKTDIQPAELNFMIDQNGSAIAC